MKFNFGGAIHMWAFGLASACMLFAVGMGSMWYFMVMTILAAINATMAFTMGREYE